MIAFVDLKCVEVVAAIAVASVAVVLLLVLPSVALLEMYLLMKRQIGFVMISFLVRHLKNNLLFHCGDHL